MPRRTRTVMRPDRPCSRCGSPGPFYASQPGIGWCVACKKQYSLAAYYVQKVTADGELSLFCLQRRLTWMQQDPSTLTRRQRHIVLRMATPPGKKLCAWCETYRARKKFAPARRQKDGLDCYCRDCRRILDHMRHAKRRKPEVAA